MWIKYRFVGTWHHKPTTSEYPSWRYIECSKNPPTNIPEYIRQYDVPDDWDCLAYRSHDYRTEYEFVNTPSNEWLQNEIKKLTQLQNKTTKKIQKFTQLLQEEPVVNNTGDFKQFLLETLQTRNEPTPTRELIHLVIEKAGERKWTASNVLTDISALEAWELVERHGIAENETFQITEKGKQADSEFLHTEGC